MKSKWPEVESKLTVIAAWCRAGMLEKDIAKKLGVSVSSFETYKTQHPELLEALKNSEADANDEVENALFQKCVGMTYDEEVAFKCKTVFWDDEGRRCEQEEIRTATVKKFLPPETMAQIIWLNNRRPDRWRRNANKEKLDVDKFQHEKEQDAKKNW